MNVFCGPKGWWDRKWDHILGSWLGLVKGILTAFSVFVDLNSAGLFFHTAPHASFKIPGYRPSNMDKKFLIWSGRFKTVDQIPEFVSWVASSCLFQTSQRNHHLIGSLHNWVKIHHKHLSRWMSSGAAVKADVFKTRSSKEESVCSLGLISTGWWPYLICCWDKSWLSRTHTPQTSHVVHSQWSKALQKMKKLWLLLT